MLQSIRDKSKGWIAYVIVGFISIPFLFFGIQSYLGAGGDTVVAEVNGTEITAQQFDRSLRMQQQRLREMFGSNIPEGLLDQEMISQSVVSGLVKNELLRQFVVDSGLQVSDTEVIAQIQSIPQFQENGQFSAEKFDQLLTAQRRNKAGFIEEFRQSMQFAQLQEVVGASSFLAPSQASQYLELKNQQRDVSYILIPRERFLAEVTPTEEEIKAYFESNGDSFQSEERVKINYLVLDLESVEQGIDVPEAEILSMYEENPSRFLSPSSRKAQQILISTDEGEALAKEVGEKLQAGEDFAQLASEYSSDSLTSEKGGDMGWIFPEDLEDAIDTALFDLSAGDVSEPVKTDRGFHILTFSEEQAGEQSSFDEVKSQLEREYRQREAEAMIVDQSEQLLTLTYENRDSLEPAADALGIKVQSSEWLTAKGGKGVLADPKVIKQSFSEDVLNNRNNSEVIEAADGKQVVLRIVDHAPAATLPLEVVESDVVAAIKRNKAKDLAKDAGIQALAKIQAGTSLAEVAEGIELDVITQGSLTRDSSKVSPEVVNQLFKVAAPVGDEIASTGFDLMSGDFLVGIVNKVSSGELAANFIESDEIVRLKATIGAGEFDALYRALESRADITINQDALTIQ